MADRGINLKILAKLGLDATEAEQAYQRFQDKVRQATEANRPPGLAPEGFGPLRGKTATEQFQERERVRQATEANRPPGLAPEGFGPLRGKTATEQFQERERVRQATEASRPPVAPMSHSEIATMRLRETFGPTFSFRDKQKEILALIAEERQRVRDLEGAYRELGKASDEAAKKKRQAIKEDLGLARAHRDALQSALEVGLRSERLAETIGQDEAWASSLLRGMTAQEAMRGGLIGRVLNAGGNLAMRHPLLAGGLAVAGAGFWGLNRMSDHAQMAQDFDIEALNLARRTGQPALTFQGRGPEIERLRALGFTPQQGLGLAEAYGMSGAGAAMSQSYRAIGAVAREAGFGSNPEVVAALARRATQMGLEPGPQQEHFWAMMQRTMAEGVRTGVDKAERMKSLFAVMEATAAKTGELSEGMVANLVGITGLLSEGGRVLAGERGAQTYMGLVDSIQNPASIAQEFMQINALKSAFGGRMPTADELQGLGILKSGYAAQRYDAMGEVQQMRLLMGELASSPQLLSRILQGLAEAAPANSEQRAALGEGIFGKVPPKVMEEVTTGMLKILEQRAPEEAAALLAKGGNVDLEIIARTLALSGTEATRLLQEKRVLPGKVSEDERVRADQAMKDLQLSEVQKHATQQYRDGVAKFEEAIAKTFLPAAERFDQAVAHFADWILGKRSAVEMLLGVLGSATEKEGGADATSRAWDAIKKEPSRAAWDILLKALGLRDPRQPFTPEEVPAPPKGRAMPQAYRDSPRPAPPAMDLPDLPRAQKMSYTPGSSGGPLTVQVTGTIALTGEHLPDGLSIPATALTRLIARRLADEADQAQGMGGHRPALHPAVTA